jgi:chromosome segregation ATPase
MTDKKLTDNEIIKALECCKGADTDCWECELFDTCKFTVQQIMQNALDLINRLQAEIKHIDNESSALLADIDFRENELNRLQAEVQTREEKLHNRKAEVNRLNSKIRGLKAENERLANGWKADVILTANVKAEAYKEFAELVQGEIDDALHSNHNAKAERMAKPNVDMADEFINYCEGKIHALSGLNSYIDNLLKELVGE